MGWGSYGGFAPYISKAEKIRRAEKARIKLMKKKGAVLEPITLSSQVIARTWWGKSWNSNLERYADYAYRLERGRSYVRCGSVIDLKIISNEINALVMGSDPNPYSIKIKIDNIDSNYHSILMKKSRESLDSLHSLLSGEFPVDLKNHFFNQGSGLFPSPKELHFNCNCPDIATMCKHVAAVMYGISARLDEKPELFFLLRGIRIDDFVNEMIEAERENILTRSKIKSSRSIVADTDEISELFGIEMENSCDDKQMPVKNKVEINTKKTDTKPAKKSKSAASAKKTVAKKAKKTVEKKMPRKSSKSEQ